jgi:phosphoribosylanthranilate isomerase
MTIVKICGIANLEDALVAIDAGADLLGFICYPPSPRYLPPEGIAAITSNIQHPICTVGVFVNESLESVRQILDQTGLDLAQIHGEESPDYVKKLGDRAFKALRPTNLSEAQADAQRFASLGPDAGPDLLVDAYHPHAYGGTGHRADWAIAANLAPSCRLLLAGGLNPGNVAEAIVQVRPWGVDVSSGVEQEPGRKDHEAVRAFVTAAKNALHLRVNHA